MGELDGSRVQEIAIEAESAAFLPGVPGPIFGALDLRSLPCRCLCLGRIDSQLLRRSVQRVADHGMSDGCHVHAYLMGTAGFDAYIQQRKLSKLRRDALASFVVGHCGAASAAA